MRLEASYERPYVKPVYVPSLIAKDLLSALLANRCTTVGGMYFCFAVGVRGLLCESLVFELLSCIFTPESVGECVLP